MMVRLRAPLVALAAGAFLPLAFSPFYLFPIAPLALAVLFFLWRDVASGRAFLLGWLFGLGFFGVGISWVYVSMSTFGNMPPLLAGLAAFVFCAGLALFPAFAGLVAIALPASSMPVRTRMLMPVVWVFFEWLRGTIMTGLPWLHVGYTHTDTPIAGFAPWVGVYGMSLAVALLAVFVLELMLAFESRSRRKAVMALGAGVCIYVFGAIAAWPEWSQPQGRALSVMIVQGNVPIQQKWSGFYQDRIRKLYLDATLAHPEADLVVWPEGAIPTYRESLPEDFVAQLKMHAERTQTEIVLGLFDRARDAAGRSHDYNAALQIGSGEGIYHKRHLVPFGEYPPLDPVFRILMRMMQIPMADQSPGADIQPLMTIAGHKASISICYETIFGDEMRRALGEASLLINISENAWFGASLGPYQLLQMTRVRARELARPLVRADNAGLSALVDHRGRVLIRSQNGTRVRMSGTIQPMMGTTPYAILGDWPVLVILLLGIAAPFVRAHVQADS